MLKKYYKKINKQEKSQMQQDANKSVLTKLVEKCGKDSQIPIVMAMDALFAGIDTTGNLYFLRENNEDKM